MHRLRQTRAYAKGGIVLAGLLLGTTIHTAAHAQDAPPSPGQRELDDYEPIGGRIGSFLLYPSAEARIEYDDNILALPGGGEDDVELTVRGAARIESQWQRHSLEANAYIQQNFHARLSSEDAMEGGARINGRLDIDRDTSARVVASIDSLVENRANIASARAALQPTRFRRADALAAVAHDFGALQLTGDAQIVLLDFDDVPAQGGGVLEQDFRDSTYLRGSLTAALEISPRVSGLLRGQVDRLSFTGEEEEPDPFDRDTTGYSLEAGVRLELDNLLSGEIRAGVLHRDVDDPSARGLTGVSFGANLDWSVTPLTTLRLFADRQVEEGGSQLVSGNVRSQARLVVEHELLRNVVLEGQASYAQIDTIGQIDVSAQEYMLMAETTWRLNRNLRVFARADRFERFSDGDFFRDFARNRVMAGVRVAF
ncbi:outer membrane beta-barrel protein [Erythrobacter sp.]|uniref:outer membrane beta-barrel protein n=1 Tax=Erythrobacter sp. TaxID=1042 RepID=UPI0025DB990F|nr:outer membrane beta-barrel protein [Erythrobacter sp.]